MAQVNLINQSVNIITGLDSVVIVDNITSIRGGRSLDITGFMPPVIKAGHVIIEETSTGELKPMPAGLDAVSGVATVGTIVAGTGYTNGVYENVPLTGGTGTGALATITVAGTVVTVVTKTYGGNGYTAGDSLTANNFYIGGTGTGFSVPVATVSDQAGTYSSLPSGHTYKGILIGTIPTAKPFAGVMIRGTVNYAAAPYSMTSILTAVRAALTHIIFQTD